MVSLGHLKQGGTRCSFTFPGGAMLAWWALITSGWTSSLGPGSLNWQLLFALFSPKIHPCSCPPFPSRKQDMRTALFLAHRESLCLNLVKSRTSMCLERFIWYTGFLTRMWSLKFPQSHKGRSVQKSAVCLGLWGRARLLSLTHSDRSAREPQNHPFLSP